jgi:hypothetical protein
MSESGRSGRSGRGKGLFESAGIRAKFMKFMNSRLFVNFARWRSWLMALGAKLAAQAQQRDIYFPAKPRGGRASRECQGADFCRN